MAKQRFPSFFLSHGGGPWPWMGAETQGAYDQLARSLAEVPLYLPYPARAVLLISAHWETRGFTLSANAKPGMIYDYGGFPEHTYSVVYPAPGAPELAERCLQLLNAAKVPASLDPERGFDHGCFTPMQVIYPEAKVPIVTMSVDKRFDPELHLRAGQALSALRDEAVLIIGSGLSFHNLGLMDRRAREPSKAFDEWLQSTLKSESQLRWDALKNWSRAPSARTAHPREEHLLPLMVALGAAHQEVATMTYHEDAFMGMWSVSSFRFG